MIPDLFAGYHIGQVRLLFRLHILDSTNAIHKETAAYVQWFSKPKAEPEKGIKIYQVSQLENSNEVILLDSIARYVQLVPKYGSVIHDSMSAENSMDICRHFYVNSFADKEVYQAVW